MFTSSASLHLIQPMVEILKTMCEKARGHILVFFGLRSEVDFVARGLTAAVFALAFESMDAGLSTTCTRSSHQSALPAVSPFCCAA